MDEVFEGDLVRLKAGGPEMMVIAVTSFTLSEAVRLRKMLFVFMKSITEIMRSITRAMS